MSDNASDDREFPPRVLLGDCDITPVAFEHLIADYFRNGSLQVTERRVDHDVFVQAAGSERPYQIDIRITELRDGLQYITLVECKKHKNAIKRDTVVLLHDKVKSLGAHKGVLVSTSPFQIGALEYAKTHGIALLTAKDGRLLYQSRSLTQPLRYPDPPDFYVLEQVSMEEDRRYRIEVVSDQATVRRKLEEWLDSQRSR